MRVKKTRWICVCCGSEFYPPWPQQLFCSAFCKVFSKVTVLSENECWPISGYLHRGYGLVRWWGRGRFAHRISYEYFHGPIPRGMLVCHTCDNPKCCNPKHLFVGTDQDNHDDCSKKGRTTRGERSGKAKFTNAHVQAIRSMSFEILNYKDVADLLQCNLSAVAKVYTRYTWRHI